MITLSLDTQQLNTQVKAVTSASDEAWGSAWRDLVMIFVRAYAATIAAWDYGNAIVRAPLAYYRRWTQTPARRPLPKLDISVDADLDAEIEQMFMESIEKDSPVPEPTKAVTSTAKAKTKSATKTSTRRGRPRKKAATTEQAVTA